MTKDKDPRFTVIEPDGSTHPGTVKTATAPAQADEPPGVRLWHRVMAERKQLNAGEHEILKQICQATDELETLELSVKDSLALRAFIVRSLGRLGFCERDKRPIGRPPQGIGITFEQLQERPRD
jgi:hypothetical protein